MKFIIYGDPKAKGRPRFARRGNFVSAYTDKKTLDYENLVKFAYLEACNNEPQMSANPIEIVINCYFIAPKSTAKKKKIMMLNNEIKHTKKPDIDNLIKAIFDGLNKIAFNDDSQIISIKATKNYAEQPRVEVEINEILT